MFKNELFFLICNKFLILFFVLIKKEKLNKKCKLKIFFFHFQEKLLLWIYNGH